MKSFITDNFLLQNKFAQTLYHDFAKDLPIIDYHCHLSPNAIATNERFSTITKVWLEGDHYKWRAMRTLGVDETYITGSASDSEKFAKWAQTVPYTMRNPLYHWTHLELARYFGVDDLLNEKSATAIYEHCNQLLQRDDYATRGLIRKMNVEVVCTTDDPADDLAFHKQMQREDESFSMLPAFRPDKAFAIAEPKSFIAYTQKLGAAANIQISSFVTLLATLENRIAFFHANGCRLSDHGIERIEHPLNDEAIDPEKTFAKVLKGTAPTQDECAMFQYSVLVQLCKLYHAHGWTQQFHLGALRNNNGRMMRQLGPDTGFDSIGDFSQARTLAAFLNELDSTNQLARTILYNLNPADNEVMATMTGNFNDGSTKGKIQFGSAWWFLDQKDGMEKQLNALSNLGLLSCFVGMLTDSRSFLSYPRHEYFRRTLCNLIGRDVENGELPNDTQWLGKIVSDICYHNAKTYFNFSKNLKADLTHA